LVPFAVGSFRTIGLAYDGLRRFEALWAPCDSSIVNEQWCVPGNTASLCSGPRAGAAATRKERIIAAGRLEVLMLAACGAMRV
jgi:hypothetical protein